MGNVVPFKPPETFERFGIDWNNAPRNERERQVREDFLTHEKSCGVNGLVSLVLLAIVSRRRGAVAEDLSAAADFAEVSWPCSYESTKTTSSPRSKRVSRTSPRHGPNACASGGAQGSPVSLAGE
jgi:hypothetical protein